MQDLLDDTLAHISKYFAVKNEHLNLAFNLDSNIATVERSVGTFEWFNEANGRGVEPSSHTGVNLCFLHP